MAERPKGWATGVASVIALVILIALLAWTLVIARPGAPPPPDPRIKTVAGTGVSGFSGDGGPATEAEISSVYGMVAATDGTLYFSDTANHRVRRVSPDGTVTTIAGIGVPGYEGNGAPANLSRLNSPRGLALGPGGVLYVADTGNHVVRAITTDGRIWTVAGTGAPDFAGEGALAVEAHLIDPQAVAVDPQAGFYITDLSSHRVLRVGADGRLRTVSGGGDEAYAPDVKQANQAGVALPTGLAVTSGRQLLFADFGLSVVQGISPEGGIHTVAGTGQTGHNGDFGPADGAALRTPDGLAVDAMDRLYIVDAGNHCVRMVDAHGIIRPIAGTGKRGSSGDGGPALLAELDLPIAIAVDGKGDVYVSDVNTHRIRMIEPQRPGG